MPQKHTRGRKADIRARMAATGEPYSVAARRLAEQDERERHQDDGAAPLVDEHQHPAPDLSALAESPFAAGEAVDVDLAAALVGACRAGCPSCQAELIPAALADRRLVAVLAGSVYANLPVPGMLAAPVTRMWHASLTAPSIGPRLSPQDATAHLVEEMAEIDVAALLEDALDHWAVGGAPAPEIITVDLTDADEREAR